MAKQERNIYQGCYGASAKSSEVKEWVKWSIKANIERQANGAPRCTLNVWGAPGTSKTSVIKSLQNEQIEFDGVLQNIKVIDIPLAQIEEMGDVLGFPIDEMEMSNPQLKETVWIRSLNSIVGQYVAKGYEETGNQRTIYAPPSWVPKDECPGVILFDDGNRASQRIMKGLMQLVQDYRTISWSIPRGWTIVFTGNPDNRYNQVTSMDMAQLTRMKHITLEVDAKEWAIWAESNNIDKRGINFVLRYPEMMIGKERTNPRSLTEFFYSLKDIQVLGIVLVQKPIETEEADLNYGLNSGMEVTPGEEMSEEDKGFADIQLDYKASAENDIDFNEDLETCEDVKLDDNLRF